MTQDDVIPRSPPCAYCGHAPRDHQAGKCWELSHAIPAGWRDCHCTTYQPPEEAP